MNAREAATLYVTLGWYPVPLDPGTKACRDSDWRDRVYDPSEFDPGDNVGLRLVAATDPDRHVKLVGVDLDSPEAVEGAWDLLPPSDAAWGRDSKAVSQVLYDSAFKKAIVLRDADDTLLELRVDHQSMCPPSRHPSGEVLRWLRPGPPRAPTVEPATLERAVRLLATRALIARYYPGQGNRHEWGLALAGTLRHLGLTETETSAVIRSAARSIPDENKVKDRLTDVRSTYARGDDDPVAGSRKLIELTGDKGQRFVTSLRAAWGGTDDSFIVDPHGRIAAREQENIKRALKRLHVTLSRDTFANQLVMQNGNFAARVLDDAATDDLWLAIQRHFGFLPPRDYHEVVINAIARAAPFHPVRDYLAELKWDGTPRIERWLIDHGGARDTAYVRAVSALVLVAAVRRVRQPGCKFDELLILEAPQGQGKSSALQALCPREEWFSDDLPMGVDSKQVIERTAGRWIIEAAELVNIRKTQAEHIKGFLSRQVDGPVRMAYARKPVYEPRQFVVIGTTNSWTYLKDATGNRRFWPVRVKEFDLEGVRSSRDQLWAEAAHREAQGASIRLDPALWSAAANEQEERRLEDPWENRLEQRFPRDETHRLVPEDAWDAVQVPVDRRTERDNERLHAVLQRLGFRRMSVRRDRHVVKGWGRDASEGQRELEEER